MRQLEHVEAVRFMNWVNGARLKWPQLAWLHHIPNGGMRNKVVAGKLKAEGVKAGVADYFLPCPKQCLGRRPGFKKATKLITYHGLYLELKAGKNTPTEDQLRFLKDMAAQGYAVAWRSGASACVDVVTAYMDGEWINEEL